MTDRLDKIKERYSQILIEGMSSKDILLFVNESIVISFEGMTEDDIKDEIVDAYGNMAWNNVVKGLE